MATLIDVLNKNAGKYCTKPILRYRTFQQDYARVLDSSDRFAQGLRNLGFAPDDLIVLYLPNISEFVTAYYGCLKAGCRVMPMNLSFRKHEVKYILNYSNPRGLIYWVRFENKIGELLNLINNQPKLIRVGDHKEIESMQFENIIESSPAISTDEYPDDNDEAVILYSSGATGNPKGAILSHACLYQSAETIVKSFGFCSDDKIVGAVPLYTYLGHSVIMNAALLSGAEIILHTRFKPEEILQSIYRTGATVMIGTPTMYRQMADYSIPGNVDLSTMRLGIISGDYLDNTLSRKCAEKFDFPLVQAYGCIESTSVISSSELGCNNHKSNLGKPFENVEAELRDLDGMPIVSCNDEGELYIKSPMNMLRYVNMQRDETDNVQMEWVHPGDICYWNEEGRLVYKGHNSEVIYKGNFPVIANEIETLLLEHDAVKEVSVIGIPDSEKNEEIKAFVVLHQDANISENDIVSFCADKVPKYKIPKQIKFVDYLPKTITGKVIKRFLK